MSVPTVSQFDAVVFDLDGTLCRRTQDLEAVYRDAFDRVGAAPFGEPAALWDALDGPPDPDDRVGYLGAGFARLTARDCRDVDPLALAEAFLDGLDDGAVEFLPNAAAVLDRVAAVASSAVDSTGAVTTPGNPPVDREAAVAFHRRALTRTLDGE